MNFSTIFVCEDTLRSSYEKNVPAPLFRKSFWLTEQACSADIVICGLGFYDLFINGKKITKGYLAPYIANPDHYVYYDKYNIAPYLTKGENVIGIMLGDGHQNEKTPLWDFNSNSTNSAPVLALSADISTSADNIHFEANDFMCKKGPVIFNDLRSGVFYDARLEEKGWNNTGFIENGWHKPIAVNAPNGTPKLFTAEPIHIYKEITPVKIIKGECVPYTCSRQMRDFDSALKPFEAPVPKNGGWIYDFGENTSGIYRLKIKGVKGQKISLQCAEQLTDGKLNYNNINFYPDGFSQRDIYYIGSNSEEIFEPMFTFHGFRYIYVYGITEEQATKNLLTCLAMSSRLETRGSFICSDDNVNKIFEMGNRSDLSNFFYFPMDCPHREKNGWTADAALSAEHHILTLGAENSWREWLCNIRAAQTDEGQLPGIIPTDKWGYEWGNGPAWDSVLFELPYRAYQYRGNKEIIYDNADAMLKYLKYISCKRDGRGIVEIGLGDWLPVGKECNEYDAPLGFTDSVMVLDMCRKSAIMFNAVNLSKHKDFAEKLGNEMLSAIRNTYLNVNTLTINKECQTSQAMGIYYNIFTKDEKPKAFAILKNIIEKDGNKFTCGCLGLRVLFHVLAEFGEAELAYKMITQKEFPSYRYWLDKGETTFLEHFLEYDNYFPESKNHHFLGDVLNWLMKYAGGLFVKSSTEVRISPIFLESLNWCKTFHKLPDGEIEIIWERKSDNIELKVIATGNVNYEIALDNCTRINKNTYNVILGGCEKSLK